MNANFNDTFTKAEINGERLGDPDGLGGPGGRSPPCVPHVCETVKLSYFYPIIEVPFTTRNLRSVALTVVEIEAIEILQTVLKKVT